MNNITAWLPRGHSCALGQLPDVVHSCAPKMWQPWHPKYYPLHVKSYQVDSFRTRPPFLPKRCVYMPPQARCPQWFVSPDINWHQWLAVLPNALRGVCPHVKRMTKAHKKTKTVFFESKTASTHWYIHIYIIWNNVYNIYICTICIILHIILYEYNIMYT